MKDQSICTVQDLIVELLRMINDQEIDLDDPIARLRSDDSSYEAVPSSELISRVTEESPKDSLEPPFVVFSQPIF